jgi:hypothetical protein
MAEVPRGFGAVRPVARRRENKVCTKLANFHATGSVSISQPAIHSA